MVCSKNIRSISIDCGSRIFKPNLLETAVPFWDPGQVSLFIVRPHGFVWGFRGELYARSGCMMVSQILRRRWAGNSSGRVMLDGGGGLEGVSVCFIDVTEDEWWAWRLVRVAIAVVNSNAERR